MVDPLLALGTTMLLLFLTDKNLSLRRDIANGYDSLHEKIRLYSLYGHYDFQRIFFPFYYDVYTTGPDNAGYLGNIVLYAIFIIAAIALIRKSFRNTIINIQKDFFNDPLKAAVILGSLVMLFVSMGEVYKTADEKNQLGYNVVNILNPLLYVHLFTNRVEQFRCLERFVWPFYFGFYIWVMYMIVGLYRQSSKNLKIWIVAGILGLGGTELYDFVSALQHNTEIGNSLSAENIAKTMPGHLDPRNYQAILPIPYYILGSEDYDYTADDYESWSNYTFRLHLNTGLPLMSSKMSRTPPVYSKYLFEFVAYDSLNNELRSRLNKKPILVAAKTSLLTDMSGYNVPSWGNSVNLYKNALQFIARHHLQAVDSADGVVFYNYYPG